MGTPYSPTLLDHSRKPRNRGTLQSPTVSQEATNPLCGDRVRIQLQLTADRIAEARFSANACAICVAAASMLTELARGLTVDEAERLTASRVTSALQADIPKARQQCVALPVTVMHAALQRHRDER
jgi:nitrogen fixation protein NifU and related proteins